MARLDISTRIDEGLETNLELEMAEVRCARHKYTQAMTAVQFTDICTQAMTAVQQTQARAAMQHTHAHTHARHTHTSEGRYATHTHMFTHMQDTRTQARAAVQHTNTHKRGRLCNTHSQAMTALCTQEMTSLHTNDDNK